MNGKIVPLQNLEGTESVFPITVSKAVMTSDTETLDSKLTNIDTQKQDVCIKQVTGSMIHVNDSVKGGLILDRATKNLIPFDLDKIKSYNTEGTWSDNAYTRDGITFTCNADGSITVNGTATALTMLSITAHRTNPDFYLEANKNYILSAKRNSDYDNTMMELFCCQNDVDGNFRKFMKISTSDAFNQYTTLTNEEVDRGCEVRLDIQEGGTIDNVTIYPMLEEAEEGQTTPSNYVPYAGYEITACGKNLIRRWVDKTYHGISYTINNDDSISISGTLYDSESNSHYPLVGKSDENNDDYLNKDYDGFGLLKKGKAYKIYVRGVSDTIKVEGFNRKDDTWTKMFSYSTDGTYTFTVPEDSDYIWCRITIYDTTRSEITGKVYVMIAEESETDMTYEPYTETKVSITPDTEFPVYGLESQEGVTNIINPYNANMTVQYAVNKVGVGLLNSATKVNELNNNLTNEDNEKFIFGKKDGVRGFYTDSSKADDSFVPFKSNSIINLGTGRSFDLKNLCPDVDYTKLTVDDFIVGASNVPASSADNYTPGAPSWMWTAVQLSAMTPITKSYNNTTGVLTLGGGTITARGYTHGDNSTVTNAYCTSNAVLFAYLKL